MYRHNFSHKTAAMSLKLAYLITAFAFCLAYSEHPVMKAQEASDCETDNNSKEVNMNYTSLGNDRDLNTTKSNSCHFQNSYNSSNKEIKSSNKTSDVLQEVPNSKEAIQEDPKGNVSESEEFDVNNTDQVSSNLKDMKLYEITNASAALNETESDDYISSAAKFGFEERLGTTENYFKGNDSHEGNETYDEEEYLNEIKEYIFPKAWTWVLIFFHTVVFVVGLMGNILVCIAVYRNHTMRTVTNYFIVNLAVADFLVIFFCLPPTVIWDVTMTWFFGVYMCKIVLYLQGVSVTVSVLTLTFISIDRWYAICFPLKFKSTTGRAKTAIGLIWFLALIFDVPELVVYQTVKKLPIDTIYFTQCEPNWSAEVDTWWNVLRTIFLYAVPLAFMTITYFQIILVLWRSGNTNQHGLDLGGNRQIYTFTMTTNTSTRGQLRSRKKAAKMLVAVVVMFALCYLPVHLLIVLRVTIGLTNSDTNQALALMSHWLCYANSAVNPIIYNFMSGKFRKEFRRAIDCCSSSGNRQPGYELNSMHFQNAVRDSGNGVRTLSSCSRRNGTDIKRSDTLLSDLKT